MLHAQNYGAISWFPIRPKSRLLKIQFYGFRPWKRQQICQNIGN